MYNGLGVEMNKTDTNVPVVRCSFNLFGRKSEKWNELKFMKLVFRKISRVCSHQEHCNDVRESKETIYTYDRRKTLIFILSYQCEPGLTRIYDYLILRGVSLMLEAALMVSREQATELPQSTALLVLPSTHAFLFFRVKVKEHKYKRELTSCLYLFCIQASWERIFVHPRASKSFLQRVRISETRVGYDHYDGAISKSNSDI